MNDLRTFRMIVNHLSVGEVFTYNNKSPVLYVALMGLHPRYLVTFAGNDKVENSKFAYVPIDSVKLRQLRAGKCSIYSVFHQPQGGLVYIHQTHPNTPPVSYAIAAGSLAHEELLEFGIPGKDVLLSGVMMNQVEAMQTHRKAMGVADYAFIARRNGDLEVAHELFKLAHTLELQATETIEGYWKPIFTESAASLLALMHGVRRENYYSKESAPNDESENK